MSGYLINTEHISTYSKTKRSTTDPKTQMRCRPTLQDTAPHGLQRDIQTQVSHPTPTDQGPDMSTGKESSPCITHPINRVRMPYQHRTHLNILRQGPRHLPDNNKSLHVSTTHHSSVAEDAIFHQNRCCSKSKRSTTDPKTQNALPTYIARYSSPWSTKGHPNSSISSNSHRPGTGDVNWQREFPVYNSSNKSCQDALSTQNTSQHISARAKAPTRSTCIIHPANRVRIPYQHTTHLNVL